MLFLALNGEKKSFLHDIPFRPLKTDNAIVNMVVEIPKNTNAKMEISPEKLDNNPIIQDVKNGALRFLKNVFPTVGCPLNYGAIPQTFEGAVDKSVFASYFSGKSADEIKKLSGDQDPLDILDIGSKAYQTGSVIRCKILGCLPMIDSGEIDLKIIAINVEDELASSINCIVDDCEKVPRGVLKFIYHYWKYYKTPTINEFLLTSDAQTDKTFVSAKKTVQLVDLMHQSYKDKFAAKAVDLSRQGDEVKYPCNEVPNPHKISPIYVDIE